MKSIVMAQQKAEIDRIKLMNELQFDEPVQKKNK